MILIIYSRKFKAKLVRIFPSQLITNATSISCLLGYSRQRTGILLNGGIFLSYELLCMMSESGSRYDIIIIPTTLSIPGSRYSVLRIHSKYLTVAATPQPANQIPRRGRAWITKLTVNGISSMTKAIEPMPAESETVLNFVPLSIRGTGNMMVL